jgi:hypothetical protein
MTQRVARFSSKTINALKQVWCRLQVFTTVLAGSGRFLKIKTNYLISKLLFQILKHLEIQFEFPSQIFVYLSDSTVA